MRADEFISNWRYIIGESILRWPIVEQASIVNEVHTKITSNGHLVVDHLIKIFKWHDPHNLNHHQRDIDNNWMPKIDVLRLAGNKRPSPIQYYEWMFKQYAPDSKYVNRCVKRHSDYSLKLKIARTDQEVYDIIDAILTEMSNDLASDDFISIRDYVDPYFNI